MPLFSGYQFLRWRLRQMLNLLPSRIQRNQLITSTDISKPIARSRPRARSNPLRIVYLFTGTYGDFVQSLLTLQNLATQFPNGELILFGADRYAQEFASELPPNLRTCKAFEAFFWILRPVDFLFTNAVGVYRVRFDYLARFAARRAYGFRHAHEVSRGGFNETLVLDPSVQNFGIENLKLLGFTGLELNSEIPSPIESPVPGWGHEKILFHIGSAGLKKDFGLKLYAQLILTILEKLEGQSLEVLLGPGDEDISLEIRSRSAIELQIFPINELIGKLKSFPGTIICFNSFLGHLCHYLKRPAIVIHRQAVPYGYDCSPMHKQVVLKVENAWDLAEFWAALEAKRQGFRS
jgi:hypothetical protein